MKIRAKFTYPVITLQIIILLAFSNSVLISQKQKNEAKFQAKVDRIAAFAELSYVEALFNYNLKVMEDISMAIMNDSDVCKILIKDDFDSVVYELKEIEEYDFIETVSLIYMDMEIGKAEIYFRTDALELEYQQLFQKIATMVIIMLILVILVISLVSGIITKPIGKISKISQEIAEGDFRNQVDIKTKDEIAIIGRSLNEIINKFRSVLLEIEEEFIIVKNSSEDIEAGNNSLIEKTGEQSSVVEQVNESMDVVKKGIDDITAGIKENNRFTKDTAMKTAKLKDISNELKSSMEAILVSTKEIQDISELINEIAFETTLLSLNASIEAARAGVDGRGFSVIAMNIRSLANRSSTSVQRIDDLVEESYVNVKSGEKIVEQALTYIGEVVGHIESLEESTADITQKIVDQELEVEEVNKLIEYLSDINNHHASLSEEYSTMTQNLYKQTKNFAEIFSRFKLK